MHRRRTADSQGLVPRHNPRGNDRHRQHHTSSDQLSLAQKWAKQSKDSQTIVTDKQGRQRFHGAFTGGFSAGHYMTVGTEEGWTPGKFVSSRDMARGGGSVKRRAQRPEDFMDEDDDMAMGRRLDARSAYAGIDLGQKRVNAAKEHRKHVQTHKPDSATDDFIVAAPPTVGEQLMNAMGWRRGHGVGPRRMNRDTGCYSIPSDTAIEDVAPKNNSFGLGYTSLRPNQFFGGDTSQARLLNVDHRGGAGIGAAAAAGFGLGALEDIGDDARAFANDDKSEYDTVLGGEEDDGDAYFHANALKMNRRKQRGGFDNRDDPSHLRRNMLERLTSGAHSHDAPDHKAQQRCSDGQPPLPGFVLSKQTRSDLLLRTYQPPQPPRDFVARHRFHKLAPLLQRRRPRKGPLPSELGSFGDGMASSAASKRAQLDAKLKAPTTGWEKSVSQEKGASAESPSASVSSAPVDGRGAPRPKLGQVPESIKALAASMANRFTAGGIQNSSTVKDMAKPPEPGLRKQQKQPIVVRSETPWQPERLLCKRFILPFIEVDMSVVRAPVAHVMPRAQPHESHHIQKQMLQSLHGVNPNGGSTSSSTSKHSEAAIDSFLQAVENEVMTERELFMQAYPDAPPLPPMPPPLPSTGDNVSRSQAPSTTKDVSKAEQGVNLFNEIFNDASSSDDESSDDEGPPQKPQKQDVASAARARQQHQPPKPAVTNVIKATPEEIAKAIAVIEGHAKSRRSGSSRAQVDGNHGSDDESNSSSASDSGSSSSSSGGGHHRKKRHKAKKKKKNRHSKNEKKHKKKSKKRHKSDRRKRSHRSSRDKRDRKS